MVTVKMTETEYKAYLLYLKSIEVLLRDEKNITRKSSLSKYLDNQDNISEIEAGIKDVIAGRITYIDPENLWESIK
jgi:hypothetical protein